MDESDPEIVFNDDGICNHCLRYDRLLAARVFSGEEAKTKLKDIQNAIKQSSKGKEYDCIIGVSGGVDSTYVAYLVKKVLGLNPLAIHFDNGWNSEIAVGNIERTLDSLGIDLYTFVIDWDEFKDLQISFLKASTPDGEIPTDHAINALLFREAAKRKIKYIINGMNFATESMFVKRWAYGHSDWKYIKSIHKRFGSIQLKNYPHFSFFDLFRWTFIQRIKVISILNYIDYKKEDVKELIEKELGWVDYGGKHYESVYTRFYQGHILPVKFNIDKRRGHLSDLIRSGQITREVALEEIKAPSYQDSLKRQDEIFVKKKFDLDDSSYLEIMNASTKNFRQYPNNEKAVMRIKNLVNFMREKGFYSK